MLFGVLSLSMASSDREKLRHLSNLAAIGALEAYVGAPDTDSYESRANAARDRAAQILQNNSKLLGQSATLGSGLGFSSPGQGNAPGNGAAGSGGVLRFGTVYYQSPPVGEDPACAGTPARYPCIDYFPPPPAALPADRSVTAISLALRTPPSNPYSFFFASMLGFGSATLSVETTSNVIPRCMAYLIDISASGLGETHSTSLTPAFNADGTIAEPDGPGNTWPSPGLFAYRLSRVQNLICADPSAGPSVPNSPQSLYLANRFEEAYWCNMPAQRGNQNPPLRRHYRSDYVPTVPIIIANKPNGGPRYLPITINAGSASESEVSQETFLIDRYFGGYNNYWGPQPYSMWFLAMHAGLRSIEATKSPADRATFIAFAGDVVGMLPPPIVPGYTFPVPSGDPIPDVNTPTLWTTPDYGLLVQMTNVLGRGMYSTSGAPIADYTLTEPNAISRGWFPSFNDPFSTFSADGAAVSMWPFWNTTNPLRAILYAIHALRACPDSAHKAIVIASDGIPSCTITGTVNSLTLTQIGTSRCTSNTDPYSEQYEAAETLLLGEVREQLMNSNIALTMLLTGEQADPHIRVRVRDASETPPRLLAPHEAVSAGLCSGIPIPGHARCSSGGESFFNIAPNCGPSDPDCSDADLDACPGSGGCTTEQKRNRRAFNRLGQPGVSLPRVNALWGQIAMDTNGLICPVMPLGPTACYVDPPPDTALPGVKVLSFSDACSGPAGASMAFSYYQLTPAEQASACVLGAQGPSPFGLFEPDPPTTIEPVG